MGKHANPAIIGGFVVGAVVLMVVGLMTFGGGKYFTERTAFAVFFEGSVTGLQVGAPVRLRGVRIGEVSEVAALVETDTGDIQIEVVIEINQGSVRQVVGEGELANLPTKDAVLFLVTVRDLRAKLVTQSIVTGQLYVALDYYPGTPASIVGSDPRYPELPAVPSDMQRLRSTLNEAMETLRELPIAEIVENLRGAIAGVDRLVNSPHIDKTLGGMDRLVNGPEIMEALQSVNEVLRNMNQLIAQIDSEVTPAMDSLQAVAEAAEEALEQVARTVAKIEETTASNPELHHQVSTALEEVSGAARSVHLLADYLERHPDALLLGKADQGGR